MRIPSIHRGAIGFAALALLAVAAGGEEGRPSNAAGHVDREFKDLSGQNLAGGDFRNEVLTMTKFHRADLSGADFTGAKMDRAELDDANLSGATGLGTVDFGFGIDAQRADFRRADLQGAKIPGTYFEGADFREANLRGAWLAGRFHEARFEGADVKDAVMLGAAGIEALRDDLRARGALVDRDDLVRAARSGRDFSRGHLSGFQLARAQLDGVDLAGANLHSAGLIMASLRHASLADALLAFADLGQARLEAADLTNARANGARLEGADLSGARCGGADFFGASLRGANLAGADLTNADLRQADLTEADLTGTTIEGVRWDAAILADLRGVAPEQEAALKSKAARWKHDLAVGFDHFAGAWTTPIWFLSWIGGIMALVMTRKNPVGRRLRKWLSVLHLVAGLPAAAFLFFLVTAADPCVQLSGSGRGWSQWAHLWPSAYGVLSGSLAVFLPVAVASGIACMRSGTKGHRFSQVAATALTGLALLAAVGVMGLLAPRA